jgi:hypothetical protein
LRDLEGHRRWLKDHIKLEEPPLLRSQKANKRPLIGRVTRVMLCNQPSLQLQSACAFHRYCNMAGTSIDAPRKHSRVLAALGDSSGIFDVPQPSQAPNALKRKIQAVSPNYESPGESSAKRVAGPSQPGMSMNRGEGSGLFVAEVQKTRSEFHFRWRPRATYRGRLK